MVWRCSICFAFFALTLRILLSHMRTHSTNPYLVIECNVEGCTQTYTRTNSYYRHILRQHQEYLDTPHRVSNSRDDSMETDTHPEGWTLEDDGDKTDSDNQSLDERGPNLSMNERDSDYSLEERDSDNQIQSDSESNQTDISEGWTEVEDFNSKDAAIKYIMKLKASHVMKETSVQAVVNGTDTFVQRTVDILKQRVYATLQEAHIDPETIQGLSQQFDEFVLPFDGIQTNYERNKFIKENYFYVFCFTFLEPEEIALGQQLAVVQRNKQKRLELVWDKYYYIPMDKSIEQLLQKQELIELALCRETATFDGQFYCDLADGSIFRQHPVFSLNPNGLQILLYFDDIEICNPIGKKAGVHKLAVFYYSLANFPVHYRSRLPLVRLLAVIKRRDLKRYGIDKVLKRINEDLNLLDMGVRLHLGQREYTLRGSLLAFIGDTLAAHEFSGFKEGVGFAYQKCRECECTNQDMQNKFQESTFIQRSLHRYDLQTQEIANAETAGMKDRLSIAYGLNRRSVARDFPHFDIINMVPEDIMHVLFEGVVIYESKLVLGSLFEQGLCTLQQLNTIIDTFPYGYKHKECRPNIIPEKLFEGSNAEDVMTLKQSSSSMMILNRLLPLFLVKRLHINCQNEYVEFITELCEIIQIILAPVISIDTIQVLKILISRHLRKFKELFPNKNIIPKQHYMIHLPSAIEKYGPLTRVWCMRFESKHQFIKQRISGSNNYKNVAKSITERSAIYECGLNVGEQHPLFYKDLEIGKAVPVADLAAAKQKINAFFGTDITVIKQVWSVTWVVCNGQKFIAEQCEVAFGESDGLPEFGHLCHIWVTTETVEASVKKQVYFGLSMYETLGYDNTVQAHLVQQNGLAQGLELVHSSNLFLPFPLHLYELGNHMYIPVSHDMVDLVQYKRHSSMRM